MGNMKYGEDIVKTKYERIESMEYGLCCKFNEEDIKFKTYTYKHIMSLPKSKAIEKVNSVVLNNIFELQRALKYCRKNNINSFRVTSEMIPQLDRMMNEGIISQEMLDKYCLKLKEIDKCGIELSVHPGQFVNMGSPKEDVVEKSVNDLHNHFILARCLGIEDINIHIGGAYGDKENTKKRFMKNMNDKLTPEELNWMTIENDEMNYCTEDVVEVAEELGIRVTMDLHHERVYRGRKNIECNDAILEELFLKARETWRGYAYQRIHISTPKSGEFCSGKARHHADYIDINDIPEWLFKYSDVHADIEAKGKEGAILKLQEDIKNKWNIIPD